MFSKNELLKTKTPSNGIGRKEFIENLVQEFYTTTNIEAQEQVTANLANFAYDPINFQHLRDANAVNLFFQLITSRNERLVLHGIAGICNICLDSLSQTEITNSKNIKILFELFETQTNADIIIHLLTTIYLLAANKSLSSNVYTKENLQRIRSLTKSSEKRIESLASIIIEDFGTLEKRTNAYTVVINKIFTQDDLDKFTMLTGDTNPIHSIQSPENERMVHGALLNGIISGIMGTRLPGPGSIVISQEFKFPHQCRINKDTTIVVKLLSKRKISLVHYECRQDDKVVFEGEAKVMSPRNNLK
ncbi:armadillo repeat-containing protein 7 [Episyrphus balteatus]|uniref:armadillo repeat-containing protein 7 n=1 Tax=Episyrphus balteatus TaxID=286459 RepID=UPI00248522E6|nr:armadillo repeat-containing protein 7 [Episyrphus balteatus]